MTYSRALEAFYEWNDNAYFNRAEARIHYLYEFLEKGIMPWMWDFKSYSGTPEKEAMYGFFYPEDIENIRQIETYKTRFHNKQATAAKSK